MARKKKKKGKRKQGQGAPAELSNEALEAEIARGEAAEDFKAMLAAAKALHKRRADPESSRRVAAAYAGRIIFLKDGRIVDETLLSGDGRAGAASAQKPAEAAR